jgi:hypothetical protein
MKPQEYPMKKPFLIALCLAVSLLVPAVSLAAEEDEHFIQSDDFFVSKDNYKDQDWMYVSLAKQLKAPAANTKNEGQFMQVADGKSLWTKYYWKTRQAMPEELKLGTVVIMFEATDNDGNYRAPESKEEARSGAWFIAKITDVSDLYKEVVTVSGGYKIKTDNFRIIEKLPGQK